MSKNYSVSLLVLNGLQLKDHWLIKADDILIEFLTALADEKNSDKMISEAFDMYELREVYYWLNIG